jgi:rod shape-determining protein MreB
MIIDVGGGAAEAAVISLGGVVAHQSVRVGGNKIDEAIATYVRRKHNLIIGDQTSETVKIKIGSATLLNKEEQMGVKGRDLFTGMPRTINITSSEVTGAIQRPLSQIIGAVKGVLEQIPPELASDIIDKGIVMTGGTSILKNFDVMMTDETGVPCHVAEDPMLAVAKGTGIALENLHLYRRSIVRR